MKSILTANILLIVLLVVVLVFVGVEMTSKKVIKTQADGSQIITRNFSGSKKSSN